MLLLSLFTKQSYANSVGLSYGQQEYQLALTDSTVVLKPMGSAVSLSLDLSENWLLDFNYQQWQDEQPFQQLSVVSLDSQTFGISVNYYVDNWSYAVSYSRSDVDTEVSSNRQQSNFRSEEIISSSIGGSVGYGLAKGNWFYSALVSSLYSEWDFDKQEGVTLLSEQAMLAPPIRVEKIAGNSTSLSTSVSVAHFWSIDAERGVLLGTLLSWHYLLSGDSVLISRNGRNVNASRQNTNNQRASANASLNTISGDDSYGQFSLYASYDLSPSWSIDVDSSINIASDYNARTWSISVGYLF
ncbi:MAG: hypothetical protein JKY81_07330 [Colwellia sp.]|nr:hypothetical protein [Colwellia sp.]